eukprot:PhF_6_TR15374/c0_g1_i1/m.23874
MLGRIIYFTAAYASGADELVFEIVGYDVSRFCESCQSSVTVITNRCLYEYALVAASRWTPSSRPTTSMSRPNRKALTRRAIYSPYDVFDSSVVPRVVNNRLVVRLPRHLSTAIPS